MFRRFMFPCFLIAVSACTTQSNPVPPEIAPIATPEVPDVTEVAAAPKFQQTSLNMLISKYAAEYDVPEALVHRVVKRESTYNPAARNGPYYGLMQILPATAGQMGFRGAPNDLLDAETNLKYAVKYLRGAWLLSHGSHDQAVKWYSQGYYYEAKRRGMLVETGLRAG